MKDAPNVDADGALSEDEESRLYRHLRPVRRPWHLRHAAGRRADQRRRAEVRVGTTRRETGRARLRKHVVTENVTKTVPVQRERVRIEREPIVGANVDAAMDGPDISEEEHEVTLHAEEPVVEKRTVPKERVRMDRDTVTDEETVSGGGAQGAHRARGRRRPALPHRGRHRPQPPLSGASALDRME